MKRIEDPKFQKVVPNTANVIYVWYKKILIFFRKNQSFVNRKFIDIHVNTEVLTTGLVL